MSVANSGAMYSGTSTEDTSSTVIAINIPSANTPETIVVTSACMFIFLLPSRAHLAPLLIGNVVFKVSAAVKAFVIRERLRVGARDTVPLAAGCAFHKSAELCHVVFWGMTSRTDDTGQHQQGHHLGTITRAGVKRS